MAVNTCAPDLFIFCFRSRRRMKCPSRHLQIMSGKLYICSPLFKVMAQWTVIGREKQLFLQDIASSNSFWRCSLQQPGLLLGLPSHPRARRHRPIIVLFILYCRVLMLGTPFASGSPSSARQEIRITQENTRAAAWIHFRSQSQQTGISVWLSLFPRLALPLLCVCLSFVWIRADEGAGAG